MTIEKKAERGLRLLELLADAPEGLNRIDTGIEEGWSDCMFNEAVQWLRDDLATNGYSYSVVCDPDPADHLGPWIYKLMDGDQIIDAQNTQWVVNRVHDAERRLFTMRGVVATAVKATDGRTNEGKRARIIDKHITRAIEDLAELNGDG